MGGALTGAGVPWSCPQSGAGQLPGSGGAVLKLPTGCSKAGAWQRRESERGAVGSEPSCWLCGLEQFLRAAEEGFSKERTRGRRPGRVRKAWDHPATPSAAWWGKCVELTTCSWGLTNDVFTVSRVFAFVRLWVFFMLQLLKNMQTLLFQNIWGSLGSSTKKKM